MSGHEERRQLPMATLVERALVVAAVIGIVAVVIVGLAS
jgi:hypothetical protein